jgi:hypothetical protein
MLSADARHMSQRSACVDRFADIYGHMALKPVEFRADPLQYRETSSGIPHVYPEIGSLWGNTGYPDVLPSSLAMCDKDSCKYVSFQHDIW